jgi:phage terminase large subunit-like protein
MLQSVPRAGAASSVMAGARHLHAALMDAAERSHWNALLALLTPQERADLHAAWQAWARHDQVPASAPPQGWHCWLALGGRGAGKTRAGAEWVKAKVEGQDWTGKPAKRLALIAATLDDARKVMVEGVSGLLAVHEDEWRPAFAPSKRLLTWPNGAMAQIFSAEEPDQLRGPQFDAAWCDELAKWRYPEATWDMLQFGLRLGDDPQVVVTTTPRPIALLKKLIGDARVLKTKASTFDNGGHLAKSFLAEMKERYQGTRLGRQELEAELIDDDPAALFRRDWIEKKRVAAGPELKRVVVAIDPPAGKGPAANACGIICAGVGHDGRGYVLDDRSAQGKTPAQWAGLAVGLYHARQADRVVAEVNQGGAMVEAVLREVDPNVAYRAVTASRGKRARAEPVAALYEQGRVSHVGSFPALEDEMCSWNAGSDESPDRLDALVWALTELMLTKPQAVPKVWFV